MARYIELLFFPGMFLAAVLLPGCGKTPSTEKEQVSVSPNRCVLTDVGEAADFVEQKNIVDDVWVIAHGVGNPQALVWRDAKTGKTFYLARVLGTKKKLYFLREVSEEETPGVPTQFKGHLLRWDHLPKARASEMMSGLKSTYNIQFDPSDTYIIVNGQKPSGCPD